MGGGVVPHTTGHWLAAIATGLSMTNVVGGFLVTTKVT